MNLSDYSVRRLGAVDAKQIGELADVLHDCVAGGASVSFMLPLTRARAVAFWRDVERGVAAGERALLVAVDAQGICGTVQLILNQPENQPHRADLAKMLVHRRARRHGLGAELMRVAETTARECGKTLLVLDTVTGGAAERLYERLGWERVGVIPDYALMPEGEPCSTTVYFRRLGIASPKFAEKKPPAPLQAKYVHTNLTGRDWRALVRFYCDVFGCRPKLPERDLAGPWLDQLTGLSAAHLTGIHLALPGFGADGPTLEIFGYDQMRDAAKPVVNEPGFGHIAFLVDDVATARQLVLRGGGSRVGGIVTTQVAGVGTLQVVYARDPEGNIIELQNWSRGAEYF